MIDFPYIDIVTRLVGILGIAASILAYQCKKHSFVIGLRTANELLFATQYLLLGGYTGAALNVISSARNIIFINLVKREKSTAIWRIVFSLFFITVSVLTFSGFPTVIFCIGKILTTYVYGSSNMKFIRIMTIVTSFMWIAYNVVFGAYEGIIADSLTIISAASAIVRIDIIGEKYSKSKS